MRTKFIIIVLLQIVLLAGIVGYRQAWVATGNKVVLKTVPVDPRDIFRGQYVHLNYEITNMNLDALKAGGKFFPNEKVFVSLVKNSDNITWSASAVGKAPEPGATYIQGRSGYESETTRWTLTVRDDAGNTKTFEQPWVGAFKKGDRAVFCLDKQERLVFFFLDSADQKQTCGQNTPLRAFIEDMTKTSSRQLSVSYGIEDYFVEEGRGPEIEQARNAKAVTVEVSLGSKGKAIISRLLIDGKPFGRE